MSFRSTAPFAGLCLLALVALTPNASAQCFNPDGLDGPCCGAVQPIIPVGLMPFTMQGTGICWDDCTPTAQTCTSVSIGTLNPTPLCTQFTAPIEVLDCAGLPLLKGTLILDYTRTWEEFNPVTLITTQVWRFAAKVDMLGMTTTLPTCPVPTCVPATGQAFYYGYLDISRACSPIALDQAAVVLFHGCDVFQHKPGLSAFPGSYHPTTSYALVAPSTAANPFVPSIMGPPSGALVSEALRAYPDPTVGFCRAEERVLGGVFLPLIQGCLCPLALAPLQQAGIRMKADTVCGSSVETLNLWPVAPWYELTSTSIGRWTTAASYPGTEHASVAEGLVVYTEACDPFGVPLKSFDILYGAITQGGFPLSPIGGPSSTNAVDLASNYSLPVGMPIALPLLGKVGPTDHLVYVNP
ncbi:MAG: hypothetical protein H8D72_00735 [Planctomycetes bacterium]|nr:hypothetical protein [Planctomycetota bacterium]